MNAISVTNNSGSSVLIVSVRGFRHQAANGTLYEFEDMIGRLAPSKLHCPPGEFSLNRKIYRLAKYASNSNELAHKCSFYPNVDLLEEEHDLILVLADNTYQLHLLNNIKGWREHRAKKACYLSELWPGSLESWRVLKEPFEDYDHIFVGLSNAVELFKEKVGVSCSFLPLGVDTDVFSPGFNAPERCIDVTYAGRRVPELHDTLLERTRELGMFYYYDTAKSQKPIIEDHVQHRSMYSSILQRSKFSFAFPAKMNLDSYTKNVAEIGARYYEFVAAGTVILGGIPDNENFDHLFGWENAVIPVTAENVMAKVEQLMAEPEELKKISAQNVVNALRKHDWVYRWSEILDQFSLNKTEAVLNRIEHLAKTANELELST